MCSGRYQAPMPEARVYSSPVKLFSYAPSVSATEVDSVSQVMHRGTKLFIVHGHDSATNMAVADFFCAS